MIWPGSRLLSRSVDLVFGLGANLGDRADALRGAVAALAGLGPIAAVSSLFETDAVGGPSGQPRHLNAAVRLKTKAVPARWLATAQAIENAAGRKRRQRHGPRVLDVDVLWADGMLVSSPDLTVPHPALEERPFAWIPLLEVAPDARPPGGGPAYRCKLQGFDWAGISPRANARLWCPEFPSEIEQLRPI